MISNVSLGKTVESETFIVEDEQQICQNRHISPNRIFMSRVLLDIREKIRKITSREQH